MTRPALFEFPLLRRELLGLLRTRRATWLLVVTVVVSSLFALLAWPSERHLMLGNSQNARSFFAFISIQLGMAFFVIPAFTAGAISGERERDTYDLLHATLLSPYSIVFSKALASIAYVLILLGASAPSVCVFYLLGGIEFGAVLKCYAITFAAVVLSGFVCLAQSMRSRRTAHAVFRGMFGVLFWNGGVVLLVLLLWWLFAVLDSSSSAFSSSLFLLFTLIPHVALGVEVWGPSEVLGSSQAAWWWLPMPAWLAFVTFAGIVTALHSVYLVLKAGQPELPASRSRERRLARSGEGATPRPPARSVLARMLLHLEESDVPLFSNPVFLKEVRSEFFAKIRFRRTLFWGPLLLFAVMAFCMSEFSSSERASIQVVSIWMTALGLVVFLLPGIVASSFPREAEQGNIDFLRGTLLTLKEVLLGKYLAGLYGCVGILAAALWVSAAAGICGSGKDVGFGYSSAEHSTLPWIFFSSVVVVFLTYAFVGALATLFSVVSKRTLGALLSTYFTLGLLYIGWPILLLASLNDDAMLPLILTHPIAGFSASIEPFRRDGLSRGGSLFLFASGAIVATMICAALSSRLVERRRGRDP